MMPDGTLSLFDGARYLVYLQGGSAGLAFVLRDYLRHRPEPDLSAVLAGVRGACQPIFVRNAGLFGGRAGLIAALAHVAVPQDAPAIHAQIRRLAWYAQSYRGHLAFPGFQMRRLSMDLATGSAGVLLALSAAFEGGTLALPCLDPRIPIRPHFEGGDSHVADPGSAGPRRGRSVPGHLP
jgi:hypothetical protein